MAVPLPRSAIANALKLGMLGPAPGHIETYVGGGGKIRCLRCTARSKRSGRQCGRPANKTSRTQKCQFHGGHSTGPKTQAGKKKVAAGHLKHGQETHQAKATRSRQSALLLQIEDSARVLGMIRGARTRGRKPVGYTPVTSITDVLELVVTEASGGDTEPTASA
jgi:hypothetical protein